MADYRERLPLATGQMLAMPAGAQLNSGCHEDSDSYVFGEPFVVEAVAEPKEGCQEVRVVGQPPLHTAFLHLPER